MSGKDHFCGWYFKCQSETDTIALIPAIHKTGGKTSCSLQFISSEESFSIPLPDRKGSVSRTMPRARFGENVFSEWGIKLNLNVPGFAASGYLSFGKPSRLRYDIMGPFCCMPFMECRHHVYSMRHSVNGQLSINGRLYRFVDALGYIEGDCGSSFPERYAWTQCFFDGGSLMLSAADVSAMSRRFDGVIGVVQLRGREYRLASYLGAKLIKAEAGEILVAQGGLTLRAELLEAHPQPLSAPDKGAMTRTIHENPLCRARYQLSENGCVLLEFESSSASFEFEY